MSKESLREKIIELMANDPDFNGAAILLVGHGIGDDSEKYDSFGEVVGPDGGPVHGALMLKMLALLTKNLQSLVAQLAAANSVPPIQITAMMQDLMRRLPEPDAKATFYELPDAGGRLRDL